MRLLNYKLDWLEILMIEPLQKRLKTSLIIYYVLQWPMSNTFPTSNKKFQRSHKITLIVMLNLNKIKEFAMMSKRVKSNIHQVYQKYFFEITNYL